MNEQLELFPLIPHSVQQRITNYKQEYCTLSSMKHFADWYSGTDDDALWIKNNWTMFSNEWRRQTDKQFWT